MAAFDETKITRAIIGAYHHKISECVQSDVIIVGAGPSGLVAAWELAKRGFKTTVLEKRLSAGGGIWGGGMGMNDVVFQDEACPVLDDLGIRHRPWKEEGLHITDAVELASGLCFKAVQAGAVLLNLTAVEDVCVHDRRVTGVVINRTTILDALPVDPIMFSARAVLDATGHEAAVVNHLRRRSLLDEESPAARGVEGPMDVGAGEAFVVAHAGQVYPGLWISGMSVCATLGGPRMGPIFGGMLLAGRRVAGMIIESIG